MYEQLEEFCGLKANGRRRFIIKKLRDCSLAPKRQAFRSRRNYENIYSRLRNGSPKESIVFLAHHDVAPGSGGALDNSSAVIEILGMLESLVKKPGEIDLTALFTDGEEDGCLGSK